jgi:hypothetical protein
MYVIPLCTGASLGIELRSCVIEVPVFCVCVATGTIGVVFTVPGVLPGVVSGIHFYSNLYVRTSVDNVIDCVANDLLMIGIRPLTMFGLVWTRVDNGVENSYVRTSVDNLFVMIRPPAMATDTIRGVLNVAVDIGYAVTLAIRVLGLVTAVIGDDVLLPEPFGFCVEFVPGVDDGARPAAFRARSGCSGRSPWRSPCSACSSWTTP